MNANQTEIYNSFLRRIDNTVDESVSAYNQSQLSKLNETFERLVDIWKSIQIDISKTNLPGDICIKLSLICDDGFRNFCKRANIH